ncbi:MAG: hypothetical protein R6W95_07355 [Desulfosarcina sp.]
MNQNFDDCGGAERNLSDAPGRSEETCCKQVDARETDDRLGDSPGGGAVEDTLPSNSQCSEVERLAALKSGTAWINYTGSAFDELWQNWIDTQDWDSMFWIFMEGAGGLSLTFPPGVDQNCVNLFYLLHRLLRSLGCERVGAYFDPEESTQTEWFGYHTLRVDRSKAFEILEMLLLHFQEQGVVIAPLSCAQYVLMRIKVVKPHQSWDLLGDDAGAESFIIYRSAGEVGRLLSPFPVPR